MHKPKHTKNKPNNKTNNKTTSQTSQNNSGDNGRYSSDSYTVCALINHITHCTPYTTHTIRYNL
jgi:hypothetical protein